MIKMCRVEYDLSVEWNDPDRDSLRGHNGQF
jgi:hypothetical protein